MAADFLDTYHYFYDNIVDQIPDILKSNPKLMDALSYKNNKITRIILDDNPGIQLKYVYAHSFSVMLCTIVPLCKEEI